MRRAAQRSPILLLLGATFAVGMLGSACTAESASPATAPSTSSTPATSSTSTEPPVSTTSTTAATTTSLDRIAEIEAIFRDLEERRLDALYRKDEAAFRALFANEAYLERSLEALELVEFIAPPGDSILLLRITEVWADSGSCIAFSVDRDYSPILGPDAIGEQGIALEKSERSGWGYSYAGDGWICDGPHPLGT